MSATLIVLLAILFASSIFAQDTITNFMSPIVSYQYPDDFSSEVLTNGGVQSPIVSFQYLEEFRQRGFDQWRHHVADCMLPVLRVAGRWHPESAIQPDGELFLAEWQLVRTRLICMAGSRMPTALPFPA